MAGGREGGRWSLVLVAGGGRFWGAWEEGSSSTCCTNPSPNLGTSHLINQLLIRPDLGPGCSTALHIKWGGK